MWHRRTFPALRLLWLGILLMSAVSWASAQQILSVSSHSVAPGANVTVAVSLNDGNGIGGIQFDLQYDPGFVGILDSNGNGDLSEEVQRGSLLQSGHLLVANATQPGRVAVVIAGTSSFLAGSGSVVTITFRVLGASGSSALSLSNVIASSPLGSSVPVSSAGGTVTVQGSSNQPPTAVDDSATTQENAAVVINVTANDTDPNGDSLTVSQVGSASHGQTAVVSSSSVRYTPSANYYGSDSFTYTVRDGQGGTASARVTVTVSQAPQESALMLFPQFVDGGDAGDSPEPNSSRIIIRNGAEQGASVRLLFRNADGSPLTVPIKGQSGEVSEVHRTVEALGVQEVETAGTGPLKSGIVEVETVSGDVSKLQGTLVFSLFGTFVSIESSPIQADHPVFVSVDPDPTLGENTGIAAYNPDSSTSAIARISLLDANGVEVASRSNVVIAPQHQLLGFVSDDDFFPGYFGGLGTPFLGTLKLTVTGGPEVAVLGLVQKTRALGSALTALSGGDTVGNSPLYFPQFYNGGDAGGSLKPNTTRIVIRNGSGSAAGRVRLAFRNSAGDSISVPVGGTEVSSVDRDIQSLGMTRLETDGTGGAKFGVVEVTPSGPAGSFSGALTYSVFGTFVSVNNSLPQTDQRLFISVNPDAVLGENTGLAAYNPSSTQSTHLRMVLRDDLGDVVASRNDVVIGPREQLLGLVTDEAFFGTEFDSLSGAFLGTLEVTVTSGPDVAILGLLQKRPAFRNALISVAAGHE